MAWIASIISDYSVISLATGAKSFFLVASVLALAYFFNRKIVITGLLILIAISWLLRFPGSDWQVANFCFMQMIFCDLFGATNWIPGAF